MPSNDASNGSGLASYDFGSDARGDALRRLSGEIDRETGRVADLAAAGLVLAGLDHFDAPNAKIGADISGDAAQLLDRMQIRVSTACAQADASQVAAQLGAVLAGEFQLSGDRDTYDDMQNADLIRVLHRRRGLPVALGIIYIQCARRAGLGASGIAFPSHFLIRVESAAGHSLLDPFDGGAELRAPDLRALLKRHFGADVELRPEHYAEVADRDILLRLQNNILTRALRAEDFARGKDILERMLALAPDNAGLYREIGAITLRLGDRLGALASFRMFAERADDAVTRTKAAALVQRLETLLRDDQDN
jgi:regulator of sirC expression with transglutaminase-like and TPR domain